MNGATNIVTAQRRKMTASSKVKPIRVIARATDVFKNYGKIAYKTVIGSESCTSEVLEEGKLPE